MKPKKTPSNLKITLDNLAATRLYQASCCIHGMRIIMSKAFRTFSFSKSPANRQFGRYSFDAVGEIDPIRSASGRIAAEMPQCRYQNLHRLPLNKYGDGEFCRFRVARGWRMAGVYVITDNNAPAYVGECEILEDRFGPNGYGGISPRNCFKGGQETNCRVNKNVLNAVSDGRNLCLWFLKVSGGKAERVRIEAELIVTLRPPWNRQ